MTLTIHRFLALLPVAAFFSCTHPNSLIDWQNKDLEKDGLFGISTDQAYAELLRGKKADSVVVAVIDSGIDTTQADLRPLLWTDPRDRSHGRNFLATETGKEDFIVALENDKAGSGYQKTLADYNNHVQKLQALISQLRASQHILALILKKIGKDDPRMEDLRNYPAPNDEERVMVSLVEERLPFYPDFAKLKFCELDNLLNEAEFHLGHGLKMGSTGQVNSDSLVNTNIDNDPLALVPDAEMGGAYHGTHTSGIIAAVRNNGQRIHGVAGHAQIMSLKCFGGIREMRNSDLARAIRFAADHGARIINMSFGKGFSVHREEVDSAVKYAISKGLLFVHSAGNDGMDLDSVSNEFFPMAKYFSGGKASAWLTVGASGYRDDSSLPAPFSNFGQQSVDVFAPGVQVTSTLPHAGTGTWQGTSQAAPVVSGLAALIWSYYPRFSAMQVKEIIMRSVVRRDVLHNKCVSGGVVNAYRALKLAADYK